jgi:hypothetical protein
MAPDRLDQQDLNRATLARQLLLERSPMAPLAAVEHLVGLQAQVPLNPYHALWSRLERFDPTSLAALVEQRAAVRVVCMRGTIHLVSADDCLQLGPLSLPVLAKEMRFHRDHAATLASLDLAPVLAFGRTLFAEPQTIPKARAAFAAEFPGVDPATLVFACRNNLVLVQVPPRGVWGKAAQVTLATAESWLGRPLVARPSVDEVVLRYVAAFGPVVVADAAAWSGLTGMREVFDRLRPRLRTFVDHRGRELFDLPDAPRPGGDVPAPARFLPEYDNALLSHADRSRFGVDDPAVRGIWDGRSMHGTVLHDGLVKGAWTLERDAASGTATIEVTHVRVPKRAAGSIEAEGRRLARFLEPNPGAHDVRMVLASAA